MIGGRNTVMYKWSILLMDGHKFISLAVRKRQEEQKKHDSEQINLLQYIANIWDKG